MLAQISRLLEGRAVDETCWALELQYGSSVVLCFIDKLHCFSELHAWQERLNCTSVCCLCQEST